MSESQVFIKVLRNWREKEGKVIMDTLKRINDIKSVKGKELDDITNAVIEFHREIGKADEAEVDPKWYELCIANKKKLKKWQEIELKEGKNKPALQKKPSFNVEYPESLTLHKGPTQTLLLKSLYKSFVTNFQEGSRAPQTVGFLQNLLKEVRIIFEDKPEEQMGKRINSICLRLARQGSRESKGKMIKGQITSKQLSKDDQQIYYDEKAWQNIRQIQKAQLQASQTGFYDEMKKKINKDACQQCRYCRKKNAYCEDMKQIRAADQPMTRFMRCNACAKAWRD